LDCWAGFKKTAEEIGLPDKWQMLLVKVFRSFVCIKKCIESKNIYLALMIDS
jgi:hypothetical protein